ncbi:hydrogenase expression/formation protein [candidate division KSB1 bacterium]|nr:hydrogenase expression/formation protein [candidate division KSB1 bacterium]
MSITLNTLYPGKLDHNFLGLLLAKYTSTDDRLVEGARIGEDATVIDNGSNYLVVKTDPITFATDQIGYYAVHVNANDIACLGGRPKWFLATILVPDRCSKKTVEDIFSQISHTCKKEKISYCGGHTEVTTGIQRPIVIGQMLGEVKKEQIKLKRHARSGDHLILVQSVPIEGLSIMAREKGRELQEQFSAEFVLKCQKLLFDPGIGVREYARIAQAAAPVHAMHDPTEGGVATAVHEFALAADVGAIIDRTKIAVLAEGKLACEYFDIDPLGCISSGSLLLAVPYKSIDPILKAFEKRHVPASDIGKLVGKKEGLILRDGAKKQRLPLFTQDEIVKIF